MTQFDAPTTAIDNITGDYTLDTSHSRLGFVARHAMVTKVRGQFGAFEGTANIDTATPANSKVDLTIDVTSVTPAAPTATATSSPATSSTSRPTRRSASSPPTSSATATTGPSPAT